MEALTPLLLQGATTAAAFILVMMVTVFIHEMGHYLVARWMGIHSEVFSIGFGRKLLEVRDRRGTAWRISWLPFGGYVKFRTSDDGTSPDGKLSYLDAPLRARAMTIAAGPVANFLFAILVFASVAMLVGAPSQEPVVGGARPLPVEQDFRPGDRILAVGEVPIRDLSDIREAASELTPAGLVSWTILREGVEIRKSGPFPGIPVIAHVRPASPAQAAGLEAGDTVLSVDGEEVFDFLSLRQRIRDSDGNAVSLSVWRDGDTRDITLRPVSTDMSSATGGFETYPMIGISVDLPFEQMTERPGPLAAAWTGVDRSLGIVSVSVSAVSNIVTGAISACNIRGVLTMAEVSGATASQGLYSFIVFLGVFSVIIGFMNLLPIPVLDGGHLAFQAWEAITGRAPGHRTAAAMMTVGVALMIGLMAFGLVNDLRCR